MSWTDAIDKFVPLSVTLESGEYNLFWDYIGEGYNGDFCEDDVFDKPLLRFYVSRWEGNDWVSVEDGSYCTEITVDAPHDNLYALGKAILFMYRDAPTKRTLERCSWMQMGIV